MSENAERAEVETHLPWCRARELEPLGQFAPSKCNCDLRTDDTPMPAAPPRVLSEQEVAELRESVAKATPGPWMLDNDDDFIDAEVCSRVIHQPDWIVRPPEDFDLMCSQAVIQQYRDNMRAIVAIRNAAPQLLDTIEALRAQVAALTQEWDRLRAGDDLYAANMWTIQQKLIGQRDAAEARAESAEAALRQVRALEDQVEAWLTESPLRLSRLTQAEELLMAVRAALRDTGGTR